MLRIEYRWLNEDNMDMNGDNAFLTLTAEQCLYQDQLLPKLLWQFNESEVNCYENEVLHRMFCDALEEAGAIEGEEEIHDAFYISFAQPRKEGVW